MSRTVEHRYAAPTAVPTDRSGRHHDAGAVLTCRTAEAPTGPNVLAAVRSPCDTVRMGDMTAVRLHFLHRGCYRTADGWHVTHAPTGWCAVRNTEHLGPCPTLAEIRLAIADRRVGGLERHRRMAAASR